jgi:hypothetical protein
MTSVNPPDNYVKLNIDSDTFEAISGCFLSVTIIVEGETKKLEGMLCIPQGNTEVFESGLCDAWLWIHKGRKIAPKTKLDITLIRLNTVDPLEMYGHSTDPYLQKHLFGFVAG